VRYTNTYGHTNSNSHAYAYNDGNSNTERNCETQSYNAASPYSRTASLIVKRG
jgi:hypothetical protein